MIRLQRSLVQGLDDPKPDPQTVRDALQNAVKLEHATIPVYLYGLYSLAPGKNVEIGKILQSVAVEEMLHMTLASNVLNAIGGSPQIDLPGFIPTYPGPLPGGVQGSLKVALASFSMAQLETYLSIEEPDDPLQFPMAVAAESTVTIGDFYAKISKAIGRLDKGAFVSPPRNQVGPDLMYEAIVVTDAPTAQQAIKTIVEQGEGTHTSPDEIVGPGYAHYYLFHADQEGASSGEDPGRSARLRLFRRAVVPRRERRIQRAARHVAVACVGQFQLHLHQPAPCAARHVQRQNNQAQFNRVLDS